MTRIIIMSIIWLVLTGCVPPPAPVGSSYPRATAGDGLDLTVASDYNIASVGGQPSSAAGGKHKCSDMVGKVGHPISFDEAKGSLGNISFPKDEFETSVDYQARISRIRDAVPGELIIRSGFDGKYAAYSADSQRFNVSEYAVDNDNTNYSWAKKKDLGIPLASEGMYGGLVLESVSTIDHYIDVVTTKMEKAEGVYEANNAFGATVEVAKISRASKVIFDRLANAPAASGPGDSETLFLPMGRRPYVPEGHTIAVILADQGRARQLKRAMTAAFLVVPKPPYFARGTSKYSPSIQSPTEINETIEVIIADIQCALILDENDFVLAGINTN